MNEYTKLTIQGDIAHLELVRKGAKNALDRNMVDSIATAVDEIEANKNLRGLMVTARGSAFCVGGDLPHFVSTFDSLEQEFDYMITRWHQSLRQMQALPIPVVVGIHGGCAGGGLGIVWVADHIVAAENTKIALGFADIGVTGDGGNTWYLPQLIGLRRTKELLLESRIINADEALSWGLVNQVVSKENVKEAVSQKVSFMSRKSLTSFAGIKKNLLASVNTSYSEQLDIELASMLDSANKDDVKLGMTAFVKRKKPKFTDKA